LDMASDGGHVEIVHLLREHGRDATAQTTCGADATAQADDEHTPLHVAAAPGHVEFACPHLQGGADATAQENDGRTPLHVAEAEGHVELARLRPGHGEDATAQADGVQTRLLPAGAEGHVELARQRLGRGEDAIAQGDGGETRLLPAGAEEHVELARLHLGRGEDAIAQADSGETRLLPAGAEEHVELARTSSHVVAADGHAELASPSLQVEERGADATAQADDVLSPLRIASQGEHNRAPRFFSLMCRSDSSDDQAQGRCCSVQ